MDYVELKKLYGFYANELTNNILSFWLPRCEDKEYGGFLNCFDNVGRNLVSYDKYAWSQGRFVWLFSRLAATEAPLFTKEQRDNFLRLAAQGTRFLMDHCLVDEKDYCVVFLMERDGTHKRVNPGDPLDMSIYADCFVILGLGMYASVSGDMDAYRFAKKLYDSALERVKQGDFRTLPYPLSERFRAHGIPMILSNTTRELLRAAQKLAPQDCGMLINQLEIFAEDILTHFVDQNNVMHEVILSENNAFFPQILGQQMNPGHTIEDVWFLLDASEICRHPEWKSQIFAVARKALENGWDPEFGGILHYTGVNGGQPAGDDTGVAEEPMTKQLSGWGDKLWWVHSEALYSTLRCYLNDGGADFLEWHNKVFEYTYRTFPNPDPEIREWMQIRERNGAPQEKVVALPVKDPFHIARNLILTIELLYEKINSKLNDGV